MHPTSCCWSARRRRCRCCTRWQRAWNACPLSYCLNQLPAAPPSLQDAFVLSAPLLHPLAGTPSIARRVFAHLVAGAGAGEELTLAAFVRYVGSLRAALDAPCDRGMRWPLVRAECGLPMQEACVLAAAATDAGTFPPLLGALYLTERHLIFRDSVLHSRRWIPLPSLPPPLDKRDTRAVSNSMA